MFRDSFFPPRRADARPRRENLGIRSLVFPLPEFAFESKSDGSWDILRVFFYTPRITSRVSCADNLGELTIHFISLSLSFCGQAER